MLSKPSVIWGQSDTDREAVEFVSAAPGLLPDGRMVQRGHAVLLCTRRGDALWWWRSVRQCVWELLGFIEN